VARSGDTSGVARRLTSNQFVGRAAELHELEQAWTAARARQPVLVLLGGESGVGKTRLIGQFERLLSEQDALVLRGEAVEQEDGELPYAALTTALRPLVRGRDPSLAELSRGSRAQLAALLPGLDDPAEGTADRHDPSAQLRLFEALVELVDLLSQRQPVALILEDMHWADRSTRTFVSFLARSLRQERVMVVLSYRTDELHRRHPLRPLVSELERLEHVRRNELHPFNRAELAEVLADILDAAPSDTLVERLYARSEGNALYTEELLAAGLDGRGATPRSLRDAFMLRIERLSPGAQRALRAIAVGRRLDQPVIEEITSIDGVALQDGLREAIAEQVLVADEDSRLRFRHALLREAVYDDLLPGERGELHLGLARALESRMAGGEEQEAELATAVAGHYAAAGDQPAALRSAVHAALAARAVHAYGEAAELAERALDLWPRVPDAEQVSALDEVDLLRLAASAHTIAGDRARAEVLVERALADVDPNTDPRRYAGLLARLARIQWQLNRGLEGVETAVRALSLLPAGQPSRERAQLMAWLARTRFLRGRFRDAIADGEEALAAAVEVDDPHSEGEILNTLGMAQIVLGQVDEGIASLRHAMALARAADDLADLSHVHSNLADMLNIVGRTSEALDVAKEGLAVVPPRITRAYDWIMLTVSELSFEAGDWADARAHLGRPPAQLDGILLIFRLLREAELALGEGDEEAAGKCLSEAEPLVASSSEPQWIGVFGALAAELHRRRHALLEARAAVEQALDRLELCTDDVARIARVSAVGACVEADIARRARDLGERGEERAAVARARIHARRLAAAAQEGGPVESAWRAVGKAELARARARNGPSLWLQAAREWDAVSRPYQGAIMRWRAAEAGVEAAERAPATAAALAALETARRLGARWLEAETVALAERGRLDLRHPEAGAGRATPASSGDEGDNPFGLTPRERQVLALIAQGATNRQIGSALFMAEKTASVHVSRILSKLSVQSRTQAAAVAHRLRLDQTTRSSQ
jgi:predicted ATPase/DNA-binding CsgD family transcriptional regulator